MQVHGNLNIKSLVMSFALLSLAALFLNGQGNQPPQADSTPWFGFAVYRGARDLCTEFVLGTRGQEIHWRSFATGDDLIRVAAFYAKHDSAAQEKRNGSVTLRHGDDIILTLSPASATDYPKCSQKVRAGEKTVIVVSQMISRGK